MPVCVRDVSHRPHPSPQLSDRMYENSHKDLKRVKLLKIKAQIIFFDIVNCYISFKGYYSFKGLQDIP